MGEDAVQLKIKLVWLDILIINEKHIETYMLDLVMYEDLVFLGI